MYDWNFALGLRHNFARGDYVVAGRAGPFVAGGLVYRKGPSAFEYGMELMLDRSEIEFEVVDSSGQKSSPQRIHPQGLMLSLYLVFLGS